MTNDSVSLGIGDVLIYFDYGLFDNLSNPLAPAGWDPLAFDPIPSLSLDGLYDALALFALPIGMGETLSGFSVEFDWLGIGDPGNQFFEVYDGIDFDNVLESGLTGTMPVTEPGAGLLMALGLLAALVGRTRRRST